MIPKILICGYTQGGKTTGARFLAEHYDCDAANTSDALKREYREYCDAGISDGIVSEASRVGLFNFAVEQCGSDPARYTRLALDTAPIVTGTRRVDEFAASRWMFDAAVWVDNPFVRPGETDEVPANACDLFVRNLWDGRTSRNDFCEELISSVTEYLTLPVAYMAGRYRMWRPDGTYDTAAMQANREAEAYWAQVAMDCGYRVFCPVATHEPIDNRWPRDEAAKRILAMCVGYVRRMPRRGVIIVRDGWEDDPESVGTRLEHDAAIERGVKPVYTKHGEDAVRDYLMELSSEGATR